MKMEEMSLSGLDNSKLEVSPPPHVCLRFFLSVFLFLRPSLNLASVPKEEFG